MSNSTLGCDLRYWRDNALEQARTNARLRIEIQRLRGELEDMASSVKVVWRIQPGADRRWDVT